MTRPPPLELLSRSVADTLAIATAVGRLLRGSDFLSLCGDLGAGKTHFVKGLARGLDVDESDPVVSPTFVLVRQYVGRLTLYHADAYRLSVAEELDQLGFAEWLAEGSVVALEWGDRFPDHCPAGAWWLELESVSADGRRVTIHCPDIARRESLAAGCATWKSG
jgi:tRNA threonylcarbamoyladenosine biosynthesis protein TsaE